MQQLPPGFQLEQPAQSSPQPAPGVIRGPAPTIDPGEGARLGLQARSVAVQEGKLADERAAERQKTKSQEESLEERLRRIDESLANLSDLESLVKESDFATGSIVGQEDFRSGDAFFGLSSLFNQTPNNVAGKIEMVQGDLINQVRKEMEESGSPIGVKGADTEKEASRLAASIAPLSQTQDEEEFLVGVERARRFYQSRRDAILKQMRNSGSRNTRTPTSAGQSQRGRNSRTPRTTTDPAVEARIKSYLEGN